MASASKPVDKNCAITAKSPEQIVKESEDKEKSEAKAQANEAGARYKDEVVEIANSTGCKEAFSLQEVTKESETWILQCGNGKSLTIRCADGACDVKK
jgi:cell division protein FtsN